MAKEKSRMTKHSKRPVGLHPSGRARAFAARIAALMALVICAATPGAALATQSQWVGEPDTGQARLVSAVNAVGDLGVIPLGLEFRLAPGWKIYWRTPGEAGLAPEIDLSDSRDDGVEGAFRWPLPERFDAFGFDNFGYGETVILPFDVRGHTVGAPLALDARMEALVCKDVCIPFSGEMELELPAGLADPSSHARAVARFAAMVPRAAALDGTSASAPAVSVARAVAHGEGLYVELAPGAPPIDDIFVEGVDGAAFKSPVAMGGGYLIPIVPPDKHDLVGRGLTLTVSAPPQAGQFDVRVGSAGGGLLPPGLSLSFYVILIAFVGGLILNLMPCVLPVLALKLSHVLDAAGASQRETRLRFLFGAAGIISSFMLMAGGLAIVKLTGGVVGWGIQFQSPLFLAVMMVMLSVFALSLLDMVTLPVPAFAQRLAFATRGGARPGYASDFMAGMLATVLATPCTAPFVGPAVAVALAGGFGELFGIFLALGAGLAAPWVLVAARPSLVAFLPAPGVWMIWMKRVLSLFLAGTVIWLGTVFATVVNVGPERQVADGGGLWQPWSRAEAERLQRSGVGVFIDVTADWCVTCKANKAFVLDRDPVASALRAARDDGQLVLLRADWTRPDPEIAAFLAEHARYGIPFNIVISPQRPGGIVLPELLGSEVVLDALSRAGVDLN